MSQQINLFNPIFLKKKKYFSTKAMLQALGLLLVGCAVVTVYANYQARALTVEAARTKSQLDVVQTRLTKVTAQFGTQPKNAGLQQEIRRAEEEMEAMKQILQILNQGELGNTDGYSEYFKAFARQTMDGVWLTALNLAGSGNGIGFKGRAASPDLVPAYITRLKRENVMRGKSFGTLEISTPARVAKASEASAGNSAEGQYIEFTLR